MLDIDTAIKHCLEVAEQNTQGLYDAIALGGQNPTQEEIARCEECAADHRQLAEWLKGYKELREENKVLMHECDRLIKEKGELLKKSEQVAEYKRLLKSATNVLKMFIPCDDDYCSECIKQRQNCEYDDRFKWLYTDEALKLIGGETDEHS